MGCTRVLPRNLIQSNAPTGVAAAGKLRTSLSQWVAGSHSDDPQVCNRHEPEHNLGGEEQPSSASSPIGESEPDTFEF